MSRVAEIESARGELTELTSKFGLALKDANGEPLIAKAVDLKLPRTILSPPKTVVPCAAELQDLGRVDPCLIVPASLPVELFPRHKSLVVGGQVRSISRSSYALTNYMIDEAARFQGFWNGQPMPMLVSIRGVYNYLVNQKSFFFRYENYVGTDIDQLTPMEPDALSLKLHRHHQGDDLSNELTIIVADFAL